MSIVKNIKHISNNEIDIISLLSNVKTNSSNFPFNMSNKNSLRNTLERINSKNKKSNSTKKTKNKTKDSEILINNYLSQRPRLNTEGNEENLMKMKFSMDFFKNKIDKVFNVNNNKSATDKKVNSQCNNDNNFRKPKRTNNFEIINKYKKADNTNMLNKKNNANFHFSRIVGNNVNLYNKKIIENTSNNEYNFTNTQNFSHTQSYFNQNNKKANNSNQIAVGNSNKTKQRNNKSEDIKKRGMVNNKIVKENKIKNFSGLILQMSPPNMTSSKLSHIQNYFRNIHKNKKVTINQKEKENNKEKNIITDEPKELNQEEEAEDFFLKDNSSNYLLVSKNPTQITNYIEKKENNKYINNYFNICESTNIEIRNDDNKKNEDRNDEDENDYDTFEEIHFYFIKKIQNGKKLKLNMNNKKS
jgi:hypothetical protein